MAHKLVDAEATVDMFLDEEVGEIGGGDLGELEEDDDGEMDDFIVPDDEVENLENKEREEAVRTRKRRSKRARIVEDDEEEEEEDVLLKSRPQGADLIREREQEKYVRNVRQRRTCADKGASVSSAQKEVQKECDERQNVTNSDADEEVLDLVCQADQGGGNSVEIQEGEAPDDLEEDREDEEVIDVDKIIVEQSQILIRRNSVVMPRATRQYAQPRVSVLFESCCNGVVRATKAQRWMEALENLPEDFFSSREATLKETEKVKQGLPAYNGVPINELNSEDMTRV